MKEELDRLESAHDDVERSIEILEFMAARMNDDPLVNPENGDNFFQNASNNLSHHLYLSDNSSDSYSYNNNDFPEISPNLEYLPSNTIIRLANKSVKKICNLSIGDKILSLCINSYPTNGKSRDSFLPRPSIKRQSSANPIQNGGSHKHSDTDSKHQSQTPLPKGQDVNCELKQLINTDH